MTDSSIKRLEELRRRGNPGVAPLWAGLLSPDGVLAHYGEASGGWGKLLCVRAYIDLLRLADARKALDELSELPPSLAALALELEEEVNAALVAGQDEAIALEPLNALEDWLSSVRAWRSTRGLPSASGIGAA